MSEEEQETIPDGGEAVETPVVEEDDTLAYFEKLAE